MAWCAGVLTDSLATYGCRVPKRTVPGQAVAISVPRDSADSGSGMKLINVAAAATSSVDCLPPRHRLDRSLASVLRETSAN